MSAYFVYPFAAFCEIAGCFAFWAWWRLDRSALWLLPGLVVLALFAWLLAQVPTDEAGRAYAAYGGVYVAASLLWLWTAEGTHAPSLGCHRHRKRAVAGKRVSERVDSGGRRIFKNKTPIE